jgi:hypothetical protein
MALSASLYGVLGFLTCWITKLLSNTLKHLIVYDIISDASAIPVFKIMTYPYDASL